MAADKSKAPPPLVEEAADLEFERTLLRDEYDVEIWLEYAADKARRGLTPAAVAMVYERALARLPGSYKLWYRYLTMRRDWIDVQDVAKQASASLVSSLNETFERALVFMNKMPRIWLMFCEFLVDQKAITRARRTFDRALYSLPSSQHMLIWDAYTKFVLQFPNIPVATAEQVLRRRVKVDPEEGRSLIVQFLKSRDRYRDAALEMFTILKETSDEEMKRQIRLELFTMFASHAEQLSGTLDLEAMVDSAESSEERVKLILSLTEHFLQLGEFDHARELFERALTRECDSIRDFAAVFESYSKFEELILEDADASGDGDELQFRSKRMRHLIDRQNFLSNQLFIEKWPGDVEARKLLFLISLAQKKSSKAIEAIVSDAFPHDQPLELFNGRGGALFMTWASKNEDTNDKERILALGCKLCWDIRDIVDLWRSRIELAIEEGDFARALRLAREALTPPPANNAGNEDQKRRPSPHRSTVLWSLYLDLEERLGTLESVRSAYEECLQQKIASVVNVLNYCSLLRRHDFYEDSFSVYERAIGTFPWPHCADLWADYLRRFLERYPGTKVERTRDLFEQCIGTVPESFRDKIDFAFHMFARFEEQSGLVKRAMDVFKRWVSFVSDEKRFDVYCMWGAKSEEHFGAPFTRRVYEEAVQNLPDIDVTRICVRFADLERRLGEIDRARALFKHGSQYADPRDSKRKDAQLFWQAWNDFEVRHGNEETYKDMHRIKRNVEARYGILHAMEDAEQTLEQKKQVQASNQAEGSSNEVAQTDENNVDEQYVDPSEIELE